MQSNGPNSSDNSIRILFCVQSGLKNLQALKKKEEIFKTRTCSFYCTVIDYNFKIQFSLCTKKKKTNSTLTECFLIWRIQGCNNSKVTQTFRFLVCQAKNFVIATWKNLLNRVCVNADMCHIDFLEGKLKMDKNKNIFINMYLLTE